MARKRKGDNISGWVNLDKPENITSTQAIGKLRRILNAQKIGHAGTLDPLATGVLPIALGEATKTIQFMQDAQKTYSFSLIWGEQRDTDDLEGQVVEKSDVRPAKQDIIDVIPEFTGYIEQTPPAFSAIKINGQRAYDLARKGKPAEIKSRTVHIKRLELIKAEQDKALFSVDCGKGTYIRSLARDIAIKLGTRAYIKTLRRERVGSFHIKDAISLDNLEQMDYLSARNEALLPLQSVLDDIPALVLKQDEAVKLKNGQALAFVSRGDFLRLTQSGLGEKGSVRHALAVFESTPVAIIEASGARIKPVRVFNI